MKKTIIVSVIISALLLSGNSMAQCNANIARTKLDAIYIDHLDGTVSDKETGLMWMKCSLGWSGALCDDGTIATFNWEEALEAAQVANDGEGTHGYNDWRLPNRIELVSLLESACVPSINSNLFPATAHDILSKYWSGSTRSDTAGSVWPVHFDVSYSLGYTKAGTGNVRLVRGGQ